MAVTKRQRETNHAIFRGHHGDEEAPRYAWKFESLKLINGEWQRVGHFQEVADMAAIGRHAAAIGGEVRLVRKRNGEVLARWRDGVLVQEGEAAE